MRYFWILAILALLTPAVWGAGTEVLDPDGLVLIEADWDTLNCNNQDVWPCLADDTDPTQLLMSDNNTIGVNVIFTFDNSATVDSTIDSVVVMLRVLVSHTNCRPAIIDSVGGQATAMRQATEFTLSATETWEEHTVKYTVNPDGDPYTWTDIDNYIVGIDNYAMQNNGTEQITKLEMTVHYSFAGAAADTYEGQAIIIGGG